MGGNYEKGLYNQLMDVMARLEAVDQKYEDKILKIEQRHEGQIARKRAMERGERAFSAEALTRYEARYVQMIDEGRAENRETHHHYAKKDEKALLNRLEKYMGNHLLFLHDFKVPFDDNMSERDLRKVKNREKMAGGFRKGSGQEMYCNILTIVETLKRRGMQLFENIRLFFIGTPAIL